MKKAFTFIFYWLLSLNLLQANDEICKPLHPFFVSVTEINHNEKTGSLEISCKFFVDDMQNALKQNYKRPVDLSNQKLVAEHSRLLTEYLLKHLLININSKAIALKFVGFEQENESVYCYFEAEKIPVPTKVVITNRILHDYKDEQINIMHVFVKGNRKSTKTEVNSTQAVLNF